MAKKKILVLDDDKSVLKTFSLILSGWGYEVIIVEKGEEAIDFLMKGVKFDLAIFDIENPFWGAMETIEKVKEFAPGLRVIVMSGNKKHEAMKNPKEHGFIFSFEKPFNYDDIKSAMEKASKD